MSGGGEERRRRQRVKEKECRQTQWQMWGGGEGAAALLVQFKTFRVRTPIPGLLADKRTGGPFYPSPTSSKQRN